MIKNNFCKIVRTINPAETTSVLGLLPRDLRFYDRLMLGLVLRYYFLSINFVFYYFFPQLWSFFVNFEIVTSFKRKCPLFPVELAINYAWLAENVLFFL